MHSASCSCGLPAQREFSIPGISGFQRTPTAFAPIHLDRYIEAQGELVETARRTGTEVPDLWSLAKERVRRGDVQAIT